MQTECTILKSLSEPTLQTLFWCLCGSFQVFKITKSVTVWPESIWFPLICMLHIYLFLVANLACRILQGKPAETMQSCPWTYNNWTAQAVSLDAVGHEASSWCTSHILWIQSFSVSFILIPPIHSGHWHTVTFFLYYQLCCRLRWKTFGGACWVEPSWANHQAHAELTTDYTGSVLQKRCCEWVLRTPKMAVAWLRLFIALRCLFILNLNSATLYS